MRDLAILITDTSSLPGKEENRTYFQIICKSAIYKKYISIGLLYLKFRFCNISSNGGSFCNTNTLIKTYCPLMIKNTPKSWEQTSQKTLLALTVLLLVFCGFIPFMWHYINCACYPCRSEHNTEVPLNAMKIRQSYCKILYTHNFTTYIQPNTISPLNGNLL